MAEHHTDGDLAGDIALLAGLSLFMLTAEVMSGAYLLAHVGDPWGVTEWALLGILLLCGPSGWAMFRTPLVRRVLKDSERRGSQ